MEVPAYLNRDQIAMRLTELSCRFPNSISGGNLFREREHILAALRITNWKIQGESGAAALLEINSSTLRGRMRKLAIHRPPYKT